eukprot:6480756-Amphidinium_carterae.1
MTEGPTHVDRYSGASVCLQRRCNAPAPHVPETSSSKLASRTGYVSQDLGLSLRSSCQDLAPSEPVSKLLLPGGSRRKRYKDFPPVRQPPPKLELCLPCASSIPPAFRLTSGIGKPSSFNCCQSFALSVSRFLGLYKTMPHLSPVALVEISLPSGARPPKGGACFPVGSSNHNSPPLNSPSDMVQLQGCVRCGGWPPPG